MRAKGLGIRKIAREVGLGVGIVLQMKATGSTFLNSRGA
jgi:hypothetical protein